MFLLLSSLGAVCTYTLGSIPLARLTRKLLHKAFPNAGTKALALASVLLDIAKGFAAVMIFCTIVGYEYAHFGALFGYLGHLYPFCPKCSGGNGIGMLLGTMIAVHPIVGLIALLAWLFTYYLYRYATLAALAAAVTTPIVASLVELGVEVFVLYPIAAVIFLKLRLRLCLLVEGNESMVVWKMENN